MEIPMLKQSRERAAAGGNAGGPHREAWANKDSSYADMYTQNVVISNEQDELQRQANEAKAPKERIVWLAESTVQGADTEPDIIKNRGEAIPGSQDGTAGGGAQVDENEEVMRALLIHEKRSAPATGGSAATAAATKGLTGANASDSESDTSESDDEMPAAPPTAPLRRVEEEDDEDDDFEEVGAAHTVMVGGRPYSYSEVSERPELVEKMSAQEKEAYIEMGQNLFQDMYY
uniref:General transcription factor IIE, polypeptide 1, alpha n=1 Tax=Neogobius melanostomus TaxID=47308 RepID=A0A8C6V033_9GOBI